MSFRNVDDKNHHLRSADIIFPAPGLNGDDRCISIRVSNSKYYWASVDCMDTDNAVWDEIPKYLYKSLKKFYKEYI